MIINIIGRGNVASHLIKAFKNKGEVIEVNPHTLSELNPMADYTLISVIDSAISEIINKLPELSGIVAHTSGSTPLDVFNNSRQKRFGVFYPLQTFSKSKDLNYSEIPFYIESSNQDTADSLFNLARMISNNVRFADSNQRKKLHIAAVFSCNFVNHLWALSDSYLKESGLDFNDLIPLISETLDKVKVIPPAKAQTGPAARGDADMIQNHLNSLAGHKKMTEIYQLLSLSIIKNNSLTQ